MRGIEEISRVDTPVCERRAEFIFCHAERFGIDQDPVHPENISDVRPGDGRPDTGYFRELFRVPPRDLYFPFDVTADIFEFSESDGGLDIRHPVIVSDLVMNETFSRGMAKVPEGSRPLREAVVIG